MLKRSLLAIMLALAVMIPTLSATQPVFAQSKEDICAGVGSATGGGSGCDPTADDDVNNTVRIAVRIFQGIVGVIGIFMFILGGMRFLTSSGDSGKVAAARSTLIYGAIGLTVAALAEILIHFVLNRVQG